MRERQSAPCLLWAGARERHLWNSSEKAWLPITAMKEELFYEGSSAGPISEKHRNGAAERSIVFNMVHIVAVGLPLLVIWLAQPGTSK